jgi:Flp pilus assembly protein TadG
MKASRNESGQIAILVLIALGLFLIAAAGLAIDGSHLYAQRRMAQAAADAAAQAALMSIFNETNNVEDSGNAAFDTTPFVCGVSDPRTPCAYAAANGFGTTVNDTVSVSFPSEVADVPPPPEGVLTDEVRFVRVEVTRSVPTTLMRLLGASATTVRATATAAILYLRQAPPVMVMHPAPKGKGLSVKDKSILAVFGGPQRSIHVNYSDQSRKNDAFECGKDGTVDLSKAGPQGTGGDISFTTGPGKKSQSGCVLLGSTGHYIRPAASMEDPLADIPDPPEPPLAPAPQPLPNGQNGCPASPLKPCKLYSPGTYTRGLLIKEETAVFKPGLYYLANREGDEKSRGFEVQKQATLLNAVGFPSSPDTGDGVLIYNAGEYDFRFSEDSSINLRGSSLNSPYKGILFFQDRTTMKEMEHNIETSGTVEIEGAIYMNNTLFTKEKKKKGGKKESVPKGTQTLKLKGGKTGMTLRGGVVVGALKVEGGATVRVYPPDALYLVRQVALVR